MVPRRIAPAIALTERTPITTLPSGETDIGEGAAPSPINATGWPPPSAATDARAPLRFVTLVLDR
jgi:hypothetical protein